MNSNLLISSQTIVKLFRNLSRKCWSGFFFFFFNVAFWKRDTFLVFAFVLMEAEVTVKKQKMKNIFNRIMKIQSNKIKCPHICFSFSFLGTTAFNVDSLCCSNNHLGELIGNIRGKKVFQTCELLLVSKRSRHTHLIEHNIQNAQFVLTFLLSALSLAFWYHSVPRRGNKLLNGCKHTCSCTTVTFQGRWAWSAPVQNWGPLTVSWRLNWQEIHPLMKRQKNSSRLI